MTAPHVQAAPAPRDPAYGVAPGNLYPRDRRERELCQTASHPDLPYISGLVGLDAAAILYSGSYRVKWEDSGNDERAREAGTVAFRLSGPFAVGLTWGATIGGLWLAMPKCSPEWVDESPREGLVRESWPLAVSLALLAGATAPIVNGIAVGYTLPQNWTDLEREMHLVTAGVAGFAGAFLPYLLPPRTLAAARELERIRVSSDGMGVVVGYGGTF